MSRLANNEFRNVQILKNLLKKSKKQTFLFLLKNSNDELDVMKKGPIVFDAPLSVFYRCVYR